MTEEFTASNGITLSFDEEGRFTYSEHGDDPRLVGKTESELWYGFTRDSRNSKALAEYYRAKEDERLGRWRHGDFVVYDRGDYVQVIHEPDGASGMLGTWTRAQASDDRDMGSGFGEAARAYFDAHPEPKPWHDAVEGEVWELTFKAGTHAWFVNGAYFQSTKTLTNILKNDPDITSARKIWPQGSDDD